MFFLCKEKSIFLSKELLALRSLQLRNVNNEKVCIEKGYVEYYEVTDIRSSMSDNY